MRFSPLKSPILAFLLVFFLTQSPPGLRAQGSLADIAAEMDTAPVDSTAAPITEDDYEIVGGDQIGANGEEETEIDEGTDGEKIAKGCISYAAVDNPQDILKYHIFSECKKTAEVVVEVNSKTPKCDEAMVIDLEPDEDGYLEFECPEGDQYKPIVTYEEKEPKAAGGQEEGEGEDDSKK